MKSNKLTETDYAALAVLKRTGNNVLEAALVAKAALEAGGARLRQKEGFSARASEATGRYR